MRTEVEVEREEKGERYRCSSKRQVVVVDERNANAEVEIRHQESHVGDDEGEQSVESVAQSTPISKFRAFYEHPDGHEGEQQLENEPGDKDAQSIRVEQILPLR